MGATTLVDFEAGGVGGELLESVGMPPVDGEQLPGYVAWLPDRVVTLHRAADKWARERLRASATHPRTRLFGGCSISLRRYSGRPVEWGQIADQVLG